MINKKIILIPILCLYINIIGHSQEHKASDTININKSTLKVVDKISKQKYLMTNFKIDNVIIKLTNELSRVSSDKELIYLTDSKNKIISCIAFWILVERDNKSVKKLYDKYSEPEKIDSFTYMINEVNRDKSKSDVKFIYTANNFYYDVYINKEYLDLIDNNNVIIYSHGCHGNCNFSYTDSCKFITDSIMESIYLTKTNGKYFYNSNPLDIAKSYSLDTFLINNYDKFVQLDNEVALNYKARFVPPAPVCYEFEIYDFFYNKSHVRLKVLNHDSSEIGYELRENEIYLFEKLKRIIK